MLTKMHILRKRLVRSKTRFSSGVLKLLSAALYSITSPAFASSSVSYHGRILRPDGSPVGGNVEFMIQIRSPGSENCRLYEESQTITLTPGTGIFSLAISGNGSRVDSNAWSFDDAMTNRKPFALSSSDCSSGSIYTPSPDDGRSIVVAFREDLSGPFETLPKQALNWVPMAIEAKTISGYGTGHLLKLEAAQSDTTLSPIQFTNLIGLINGGSNLYVNSSTGAGAAIPSVPGNPGTLVSGALWYDSTTRLLKYFDGTSPVIVGSSSGASGTLSSLNGLTVATQTFGPIALTGSNPLWTSSSGTHTLSIPLAASGGVGAGLISSAQYDALNLKLGPSLAAGNIFVGNSSGVATAVSPSGDIYLTASGATILDKIHGVSVSSATPVDGQVLRYGSTAWTPNFLSMADIRSTVTPSNTIFPSTSCTVAQTLTWSSLTDTFVCSSIAIDSARINFGTGVTASSVFASPSGSAGAPSFRALQPSDLPVGTITQWSNGTMSSINYSSGNVGIGSATPAGELDVAGKIFVNGIQTIYNPATAFTGTLIIGDGGASLSHASGPQGYYNTSVGRSSLTSVTNGYSNTAIGSSALFSNSSGFENTAIGMSALYSNSTGQGNTAIGSATMLQNSSGSGNTAIGNGVLYANTTGISNVGVGSNALNLNTTGAANTVIGAGALRNNTSGIYNIAFGSSAGSTLSDGSTANATSNSSLFLGTLTKAMAAGGTNEIVIGYDATGLGSNSVILGNSSISKTRLQGNVGIGTSNPGYNLDVVGDINASGSVRAAGVVLTSDLRFKKNIRSVDRALEKILSLRGVRYEWRRDEFPSRHFNSREQIGVIAQEIERVFPEAVDTGADGFKAVNYSSLVSPLIESTKEIYGICTETHSEISDMDRRFSVVEELNRALKSDNDSLKRENDQIKAYLCKKDPAAPFCY